MEVSTIMSSPGLNGANPADGTDRALFAPLLSERFSHLLDQRAGKGDVAVGQADPSANTMFLNAIAASMQQREPGIGFMQSEEKEVFMDPTRQAKEGEAEKTAQPEKDEGGEVGFPKNELPETAAKPALMALQWNPAFDANPSMVANTTKTTPEISAWQSTRNDQSAISTISGSSQTWSQTEAQFTGHVDKIGPQVFPQATDGNVLKQGSETESSLQATETKVQTEALPIQKDASAAFAGQQIFDSQSGNASIKGKVEVLTGNDAIMAIQDNSEESAAIKKPVSPFSSSSAPETSPDNLLRQGDGAKTAVGEISLVKGENRFFNGTLPQPGEVSKNQARPDSSINGKTGMEIKDATVAYKGSDVKTATTAGSNPGAPASDIQSALQAEVPNRVFETRYLNNTGLMPQQSLKESGEWKKFHNTSDKQEVKAEQNGVNLSVKAGLNSAEPAHGQQRIETAFAEGAKSSLKEAVLDTLGKSGEEKSTTMDSSGITLHGAGEVRMHGENRLPTPANDGKATFADHVNHQVREKLESGDFALNKGNITLKLHPEDLGELKINLRMEDQRLKVEIVTENHSVKEALMQNLDSLKETLSRQHITMDRFNVTADLRQGFQQGSRDGSRMMQDNRGTGTPFNAADAVDEGTVQKTPYSWENDSSLVSLIL